MEVFFFQEEGFWGGGGGDIDGPRFTRLYRNQQIRFTWRLPQIAWSGSVSFKSATNVRKYRG